MKLPFTSSLFLNISILAAVLLSLASASPQHDNDTRRRRTTRAAQQPRIVGGSISAEGQFPWYAASAGTLFCGASLVHADILLTAAHCQDVLTVASGVFVGSNRKGQGAVYRRIRQALVHPLYDATTLQRDYMLLKLSSPITDITPVPLNEQNSVPVDGQLLTLMGFGKNGDDGNLTTTLRDVEVVAMNHDLCARQYANVTGFDGVTTVQLDAAVDLCAGVPQGGKGQCQGDSGGPLITADGVQVGVISSGNGCANPDFPGISARVSGAMDWIRQGICDLSRTKPTPCGPVYPDTVPQGSQCFATTAELRDAVDQYMIRDRATTLSLAATYGLRMGDWCVSQISDFSHLFSALRNPGMVTFNEDISAWDMSSAVNCSQMFRGAANFNANVGSWDVSNVVDMSYMFRGDTVFDQDIGGWNVGAARDMSHMFRECPLFNQDIGGWNTASVTDMGRMFRIATSFQQDLSAWTVSNVVNMQSMFVDAVSFNSDISGWDVSRVEDMSYMFWGARTFNQPIGRWNVSNVRTMLSMFYEAVAFNADLSGWNVSRVTTMRNMFHTAIFFNHPLSNWDTSNVVNMKSMFHEASFFNSDISMWDVSSVRDMSFMFFYAFSFNRDIGAWNTSSVRTVNGMFDQAQAFNQDISRWDISSIRDLYNVFHSAFRFNQNLCAWGEHLSPRIPVSGLFTATSCPAASNPNLSSDPPGPLCHSCSGYQKSDPAVARLRAPGDSSSMVEKSADKDVEESSAATAAGCTLLLSMFVVAIW